MMFCCFFALYSVILSEKYRFLEIIEGCGQNTNSIVWLKIKPFKARAQPASRLVHNKGFFSKIFEIFFNSLLNSFQNGRRKTRTLATSTCGRTIGTTTTSKMTLQSSSGRIYSLSYNSRFRIFLAFLPNAHGFGEKN